MDRDAGLNVLAIIPVITDQMAADLALADERSLRAGLMGANPAGLFRISG